MPNQKEFCNQLIRFTSLNFGLVEGVSDFRPLILTFKHRILLVEQGWTKLQLHEFAVEANRLVL